MSAVGEGVRCFAWVLLLAVVASAGPLTDTRAADKRAQLLRKRGGSAATEQAVTAGLAWLARHQGKSGLWDADGFMSVHACSCDGKGGGWHSEPVPCAFDREVSALALLAFLGAGHTHRQGPHQKIVARALDALNGESGSETLFATAYRTQAFAEAFDLTGDTELRAAAASGVRALLDARKDDGGWRYYPGMRMAAGVPTTTAVCVALCAAAEAGIDTGRSWQEPLLRWLAPLENKKNGRVAYTVDGHKMGYTPTTTNAASALLMRLRLGAASNDPGVARGARAVAKRKPKWSIRFKTLTVKGKKRRVQIGYLQHYYWWQATEALARRGGSSWSAWNGALKKALLPKQRKDGHFVGSFDPAGTYGKVGGRVFSTALCVMALEAPYRYAQQR